MAQIDNDYVQKQCQRLSNKLADLGAIADSAAATAQGGDLAAVKAILLEADQKFKKIAIRRQRILDLITELLE